MAQGLYRYDAGTQTLIALDKDVAEGALLSADLDDDHWPEDAAAVVIVGAECDNRLAALS